MGNQQQNRGAPARPGRTLAKSDVSSSEPAVKSRAGKKSILDHMANRLNMDPMDLQRTLMATVFAGASNEEFASLLVVSEAYKLNPLTKEIYAFPKKGGGIMPVVSIDGWIRIMNEHPEFDGIEWEDISDDKGELAAIETTIYRKDRIRPVKVTEYLSECKQNTDPWRNMPARMLRHKSTIQCARYAFGFSGIYDEGDFEVVAGRGGGAFDALPPMRDVTPKDNQANSEPAPTKVVHGTRDERPAQPEAEEVAHDKETGEIIDAQELKPEEHPSYAKAQEIIADAGKATMIVDLNNLRARTLEELELMPDEVSSPVYEALDNAEKRLKGGA